MHTYIELSFIIIKYKHTLKYIKGDMHRATAGPTENNYTSYAFGNYLSHNYFKKTTMELRLLVQSLIKTGQLHSLEGPSKCGHAEAKLTATQRNLASVQGWEVGQFASCIC